LSILRDRREYLSRTEDDGWEPEQRQALLSSLRGKKAMIVAVRDRMVSRTVVAQAVAATVPYSQFNR
jgi:hypothetical protein